MEEFNNSNIYDKGQKCIHNGVKYVFNPISNRSTNQSPSSDDGWKVDMQKVNAKTEGLTTELLNMNLHDDYYDKELDCLIIKAIGGWIYYKYNHEDEMLPGVFVPDIRK